MNTDNRLIAPAYRILLEPVANEYVSDIQRGFIRAETISFDDYIACSGESGARDAGKLRIEGSDYRVVDGDVFHFRFNV